ncbi:MAG: acetyl-CoA hydrolase [Rhizobiales bacterium]|nr:acetyl-CoA hydrolase [Hyphomicrobiales bacterium]
MSAPKLHDIRAAPLRLASPQEVARAILARTGKQIVLAMPLGLGKANLIANALYDLAVTDPTISLRIFTALTLEKPRAKSDLESRFLTPFAERLFGAYPGLHYARDLHAGCLPANVEVNEFFFQAGSWLATPLAQQSYISANYTHAGDYVLEAGVNVVAQLVAHDDTQDRPVSVSCNPDLILDLLKARAAGEADFVMAAEIHPDLPFMGGEAAIALNNLDILLDAPEQRYPLFSVPKEAVSLTDYAIGLHAARLVADGGTLQIGIGSIGDAIGKALILRQQKNDEFQAISKGLPMGPAWPATPETGLFEQGLYGASEMLVECFLDLIDAGVIKRRVDGALIHAGFFLGSEQLYKRLRDMTPEARNAIGMKPIVFINDLYGGEEAKRQARIKARFLNNAMMVTLLGAAVSDGLADGRVVSGVGGQYNFVAQAFALKDARSVIMLRATRDAGGKTQSNIVWNYGHTTIPRHLRDVVITEYGVADLRGKKDSAVIAALLAITDSRFQEKLLKEAKAAGKIDRDYVIPPEARNNTPRRLKSTLTPAREQGLLPAYPFGCDFTAEELTLVPALTRLKAAASAPWQILTLLLKGDSAPGNSREAAALKRMGLATPKTLKERFTARLLRGALKSR